MSPPSSTRVIELTPAGRGAVAVVLVAGPRAIEVVDACFFRADSRSVGHWPVGRILVGRWGTPAGEELVVCRRSSDAVEVHSHGGVAAVRGVVDRLRELGCEPMPWQDWLAATAANSIESAARIALAEASTARTAAILLDQYQGALSAAIQSTIDAAKLNDWPTAIGLLDAMLAHRGVGLHLTRPWRVVIAGRPNVGKSSLMNSLVGFERAIVCDLPGTTRDVVTAATAIDGWPIALADTAGLRDSRDEIESAGVALATAAASAADLVLLVDDGELGDEIALPPASSVLRVLNKIDLPTAQAARPRQHFDLCTSVVTGEGIAPLVAAIGSTLVATPPAPGAAVPFLPEHVERLDCALAAARVRDSTAVESCLQPLLG